MIRSKEGDMAKINGEFDPRVHVMVLPYPVQGHINPMVQFAKRLASKGLKVTVATTVSTFTAIALNGVDVEPISDGFDQGGAIFADQVESFKTVGTITLREVLHKKAELGCPVKCIVYDSFLYWVVGLAKEEGVKCAPFFTYSYAVCALFMRVQGGAVLRLPADGESTPVEVVPGFPPIKFDELPTHLTAPASPTYLQVNLDQFINSEEADWVFNASFEQLEIKVLEAMLATFPVRMIGPTVPSAYLDGRMKDDKAYGANLWKPAGEECLQWLSTKPARSVIYASFGSMADLKPKQIEELAWGLRDSGHHFLWVVKERQQPMLPGGYTEAVGEVGLVVSWCNQLQVLAHSAVGCFVTHCGWNSTMEGLCLGVPMVGMPQWADQTCNVKMVEEIWGVGLKASVGEEGVVGREEVVRCVREVMDGGRSEEVRRNAGNWRKLAMEAVGEGGSSDKNIDEFVKELVHGKLV